jgi:outer membrane protein OmpA-like peptidoglycan-associated protein
MKKISLLALALAIVALPGCRDKQQGATAQKSKKSSSSRYVRTNMDADDADVEDLDDSDDLDDLSDIDLDEDLDIDALLKEIEDSEDMEDADGDMEEDLSDTSDTFDEDAQEESEFAWIDEQADDEMRKLYFSFNHYGMRVDQKDSLAYDIEQVKQLVAQAGNTTPTIVVEGHACQEGARSYNVGLSEKRAKVVADIFVAAGIDKDLIKVIGRGQECPLLADGKVINGSREDRAPNRRVEVRVIYT